MLETMYHLIHGEWTFGYESWKGKSKFGIYIFYYDGWYYVGHLGKFWISCYY